jgi:hypothetical protein
VLGDGRKPAAAKVVIELLDSNLAVAEDKSMDMSRSQRACFFWLRSTKMMLWVILL